MPATAKGYRYPADTGAIAYGSNDIKNLANDLNPRAGSTASGKLTLSPANEAVKSATVTYPTGRFVNQPVAVVTSGNSNWFGAVGSPTLTSFAAYIRHYQAAAATTDIATYWLAHW